MDLQLLQKVDKTKTLLRAERNIFEKTKAGFFKTKPEFLDLQLLLKVDKRSFSF